MPAKKKVITPTTPLPVPTTTSPEATSSLPPTITPTPIVVPTTVPTASSSGLVDTPPTGVMPTPTAGFEPTDGKEFAGFRPRKTQVTAAPLVVTELQDSAGYAARFGGAVPGSVPVANAVSIAYRWRVIRTAIALFSAYVEDQDGFAWKNALTLLGQLEPVFQSAVALDPSVATTYPGLVRFFEVRKVAAKAAIVTKKKNAKVKAAKEAQATVTTAVNAALAQAAPTGASGAATNAATVAAPATPAPAGRVVTVTG